MYIGRIVAVARTTEGSLCGAYRVSSRSFPNRTAVVGEGKVSVVPKPGHESDVFKNPYIAYNCARIICDGRVAVVTNGSQTDPIAEKVEMGLPVRDAVATALMALDYEKDQYNTPRIVAVVDAREEGAGWLGVVRDNGVEVRRVFLDPGTFWYVATYEECHITERQGGQFPASTAEEACAFLLGGGVFEQRANPVTAVAALADGDGFALHAADAPQNG
jgi:IMP cyclohydrolase